MIEHREITQVILHCDECLNTYTGDYEESVEEVIGFARDVGWIVNEIETACPATVKRRRDEAITVGARLTRPDDGTAVGSASDRSQKPMTQQEIREWAQRIAEDVADLTD